MSSLKLLQHASSFPVIISDPGIAVSYIDALTVGKRFRAAAIGLLFYDHMISLDREIDLVWSKSKRHPMFYLYMFNRFFAFGYYIFDTVPINYNGLVTSEICVIYLLVDVAVTALTTITIQVILQLRIYALYERSRKVLIAMLIFCALEASSMGVVIALIMHHLFQTKIPDTSLGCAYSELPKVAPLLFLPGLVYEPILCALVAYKAISTSTRVPLIRTIARDSLIYFVAVFVELMACTLVWAIKPQYMNIVNPWSAALPSLLGSRLILNMRETVEHQDSSLSYILEEFSTNPPYRGQEIELSMTNTKDAPLDSTISPLT